VKATGLTKGGLYGHFPSKEDIWYAVYDEALTIWKAVVFQGIDPGSKPLERIQTFIENDIRNKLGNNVFEGVTAFYRVLASWPDCCAPGWNKPINRERSKRI
jgi:AcrR family transcriptional regulator